jgi:hypothetical protein
MKKFFEYLIPTLLIAAAVLGLVFGAILIFWKAELLGRAQNSIPNLKSMEEFENVFNKVFDFPSPVGDEEAGRFTAARVLLLISQEGQPEAGSRIIVDYVDDHLQKENVRNVIASAQMRLVLWEVFRTNENDFNMAEEGYLKALAVAPKLPVVLYNLLELYKSKGETAKMESVARRIVELWPNDSETKKLLSDFGQ